MVDKWISFHSPSSITLKTCVHLAIVIFLSDIMWHKSFELGIAGFLFLGSEVMLSREFYLSSIGAGNEFRQFLGTIWTLFALYIFSTQLGYIQGIGYALVTIIVLEVTLFFIYFFHSEKIKDLGYLAFYLVFQVIVLACVIVGTASLNPL